MLSAASVTSSSRSTTRPTKYNFNFLSGDKTTPATTGGYVASSSSANKLSSSSSSVSGVHFRKPLSRTASSKYGRTPLVHSSTSRANPTPSSASSVNKSTLVSLVEGRGIARGEIGLACIDLKNPQLILSQFSDTQTYIKVITNLQLYNPVEIIMPNTACESAVRSGVPGGSKLFQLVSANFPQTTITTVQRKYFNETKGLQYISHLCVPEYSSVEMEVNSKYYCLAAGAALLKYVEYIQNVVYAPHSLKILFRGSDNTMMIDSSTSKHLELLGSGTFRNPTSLFSVMHHTQTVSGTRLLRANLLQPPSDLQTVLARQEAVATLTSDETLFHTLRTVLSRFIDLDHLINFFVQLPKAETVKSAETKLAHVLCVKYVLELVSPLRAALEHTDNPLLATCFKVLEDSRYAKMLESCNRIIQDDARYQKGVVNMLTQKCFAIKTNINGLLDIARRTYTETVDDIAEMVSQMGEHYNLPLRTAYSAGRGFYIQMFESRRGTPELPPIFLKVVRSRNTVTCTTEDLIKMNDRIKESLNEIYLMSNVIISGLLTEIRDDIGCLYKLSESISILDMITAFAYLVTISDSYIRPEFTDTMAIKGGRHPILDKLGGDAIVSNSTFISEENNFVIITGPNMSGKSTYLRQVALLQVMAQMGSFVPAEYASFRMMDRVFSRLAANDSVEGNASTLTLELRETNYILQNLTPHSLVIVDELGRGTSIIDGLSIAYGICEHLIYAKAFILFTTHFQELVDLDHVYPNVVNYHFEVEQSEDGLLQCSHVLSIGSSLEKNYGLKLSEISSMPASIVKEAFKLTEEFPSSQRCLEQGELSRRDRTLFKLASHLIQVARNSLLDDDTLRTYLVSLVQQFREELEAA